MKKQKYFCHCLLLLMFSFALLCFISCSANKTVSTDQYDYTPGESTYRKAVIHQFQADENLIKQLPDASVLCENATFQELLKIGTIPMIVKTASTSLKEADTIIVIVRLTSGDTKSVHDKTKTVSMKMTAQVRLIDASNGKTLNEINISPADHPSLNSRENGIELGKLIAHHISRSVRNK